LFKYCLSSMISDPGTVDCSADSDAGLKTMFVDIVQKERIDRGQRPALRPVFLKVHGIVKGELEIRLDVGANLRQGIFAGSRWPVWLRFSSDTLPERHGWRTTIGVGMKLFGVPGEKLFGDDGAGTFDLIFQNHDIFFVDTASVMCDFTRASVIDGKIDDWLAAHPKTAAILDDMAKPEASVLSARYWTTLPAAFGPDDYAKFSLVPEIDLEPPASQPVDPDYLAADLAKRLKAKGARFVLSVQLRSNPSTMPLDEATKRWREEESPFLPLADLTIPPQDTGSPGVAEFGENLAFNIWRVTAEHEPVGSIARARRTAYAASAKLRRMTNGVSEAEPGGIS
jgi:hypothetical protein